MASPPDPSHLQRRLRDAAAELDRVTRQVREVEARVRGTIGASATTADKRMLSALGQVEGSAHGAQQALSAAASGLGKR
jgi:hypothetical protein